MAPVCEGEVKMGHRVRCFFDIEIDGIPSGRVVFELFSDACPKTCENFRALCTGELGDGKTTGKPLHYRGVKFHRVIKDFMIQAGDFSAGNGTGGESIYGGQFEDENFDLHHDEPFLLSMANKGKNTNGSQFFITTQPATHLDGKHVVFGRVVNGQEVVAIIENLPIDNRSRPLQPAVISNCGELILQRTIRMKEKKRKKKKEAVSSSESDSDADKKKKKKKKKKEKKQKHEKTESSDEEGEVKDDGTETVGDTSKMRSHPLVSVSIINPDEIPDVPKNRFLYRAGPENNDEGRVDRNRERPSSTVRAYTKSGRKVKGRGSLRYRTPSRSRSRSRSRTPPHWRQAQRRTISYEQLQKINEEKARREQERLTRQQEREQEIEERRRRREQRHRENEENGGKPNENPKFGGQGDREPGGMRGDWRDSHDKMRRNFRDGRLPQGWRNGRDRSRGGEHDWREAQERTRAEEESREGRNMDWKSDREERELGHQDLRKKLQNQRERLEDGDNDIGKRMHRQNHHSEKNDEKKEQEDLKAKQQDGIRKEKPDDLDETALDYEAMENEDDDDDDDEGKKNTDSKNIEQSKSDPKLSPTQERNEKMRGEENTKRKEREKEADSKKETSNTSKKDQSSDKNKDQSERHRERTRERHRPGGDRFSYSRETHHNRSRDRNNSRARDRRNRSRERRDRSRDRRDRPRDRGIRKDKSRERERRDKSRERRSRSRERSRDRRRRHSNSSRSNSSSSRSSKSSRSN